MKVYIDNGASLVLLKPLIREGAVYQAPIENDYRKHGVKMLPGIPFTVGVSKIGGPDFIPGAEADEINKILPHMRQWQDRARVLCVARYGADVFVSEDVADIINNKLQLEAIASAKILRSSELGLGSSDKARKGP